MVAAVKLTGGPSLSGNTNRQPFAAGISRAPLDSSTATAMRLPASLLDHLQIIVPGFAEEESRVQRALSPDVVADDAA